MKSFITEAFAVYDTDDRGYSQGKPLSYWPIRAAAEASKTDHYKTVYPVKILNLNEEKYHLKYEKDISKSLVDKIKSFVPTQIFQNYIYENGFDGSVYFSNLTRFIDKQPMNKQFNFLKVSVISDGEKVFLLEYPEQITIQKLTMSRELAVNHALSKLTDEEKTLLGL